MDSVHQASGFASIRLNSDILSWTEVAGATRRVKVPAAPGERYVGLVLAFSTGTGEPLAIFPNSVVQRMRVAAGQRNTRMEKGGSVCPALSV